MNDSTAGKLLEKVGGVFKNEGLVEKGQQKRAAAGNNDEYGSGNTGSDSYGSSGRNDDSYGSSNNNRDNNY